MYVKSLANTVLYTIVACVVAVSGEMFPHVNESHEKRLVHDLLTKYSEGGIQGRPVLKHNDTINVTFGLDLIYIDIEEKNQVLKINVWNRFAWRDIFLQWDPEEYGNVRDIRVPSDRIWVPDIKLYNYADDRLKEHRETHCVLTNDGGILWMPQAVYKSACAINIVNFPFDIQNCLLKFGSWTYGGEYLDMLMETNVTGFRNGSYIANKEWDVIDHRAKRTKQYYACCPGSYVDITFNLTLKRRAIMYNYILILPCVLLSTLTLVLFLIPPESPAKMQLGMNIFVAFFVLLLLLEDSLPAASDKMPYIGAFFCLNMILITLSAFLNVLVVNLVVNNFKRPVPVLVKKIFVRFLGRLVWVTMPDFHMESMYDENCAAVCKQPLLVTTAVTSGVAKWKTKTFKKPEVMTNGHAVPPLSQKPRSGITAENLSEMIPLKDLNLVTQHWLARSNLKDKRDKLLKEWKAVALTMDRLFFLLYLFTIITALSTIFPHDDNNFIAKQVDG